MCGLLQDADEVVRIAQYYEQRGESEKAADMWVKAAQPDKAVQLYIQVRLGSWAADVCVRVSLVRNPQAMGRRRTGY